MLQISSTFRRYPRQFWFLIFGMLVSTTGMGMIWPFLTIYIREKLGVPLTTVTTLLALDSIMSIGASFLAGPVADRFGRKWVMVLSLGMMGVVYGVMSQATSLGFFAVLMALRGLFVPLYRIGADAMVADLIPEEDRVEAYSISRMINNVGVALGPSAGGFVAATSYDAAFGVAAASLFTFTTFVALVMRETMPAREAHKTGQTPVAGYGRILGDRRFLPVILGYTFVGMASSLVFVLLTTYAKENYGIPENQMGFVMAVNALMVVFLQYPVTRVTRRFHALPVLGVGALFYALGVGANALGSTFLHFAIAMAITTIGELIIMPTSTTYVANLAPPDMRARYMSLYWLGWGISHGFGPVVGGILNDTLAPRAIWVGGAGWALLSAVVYFWMTARKDRAARAAVDQTRP